MAAAAVGEGMQGEGRSGSGVWRAEGGVRGGGGEPAGRGW